jgi:hypothetical protein
METQNRNHRHGHRKFNVAHALKEVGHALKPAGHLAEKIVETPSHLIDKTAGVMNNMSLPLILIGGVVLFVIVKDKL